MSRPRSPLALCAVACGVAFAGCDGTVDALPGVASPGPSLGIEAPSPLLESRAVDRATLRPIVTLSDGQSVGMVPVSGTTQWTGTVQVPRSSSVVVSIEWRASHEGRTLPLARTERRVDIDEAGAAVVLGSGEYDFDTGLDFDDDGTPNIDELEASTDPFRAESVAANDDASPGSEAPVTDEVDPADDAAPDVTAGGVVSVDVSPPRIAPDATPDEDENDDEDALPVADTAVDVFVPRIARSDKPRIDGLGVVLGDDGRFGGEWADAVQVDASGVPLGVNNLMIDLGTDEADGTPWRRWAVMHDGKWLYVVVTVEDDGERVEDSDTIWEDDSLEIFLDGDHSRALAYGDENDHHVYLGLLPPGTSRAANSNDVEDWEPGPFSTGTDLKLEFETGPGAGPDGLQRANYEQDVYEFRVELKSADIEVGRPFGFELQVNDDDDGGTRDAKWGWAHPSRVADDVDFTYANPSYMGTLLLD